MLRWRRRGERPQDEHSLIVFQTLTTVTIHGTPQTCLGFYDRFLNLIVTMPCERGLLPSCMDEKTSVYRIKKTLLESGRTRICILVGLTPGHTFPPPCGTGLPASCHPRLPGSWASAHSVPSGRSVLPLSLHLSSDPSSNGSFLRLRNQTSNPLLRTPTAFHLQSAHISVLRELFI